MVAERVVHELLGVSCLDLEAAQPKQNIVVSRSFGKIVTEEEELLEAISCYGSRAAEKLRAQRSRCGILHVFLTTNRYRTSEPQYQASTTWSFDCATNDTREIIHAARACLSSLYREGFSYSKCGIMLCAISSNKAIQGNLLHAPDYQRSELDDEGSRSAQRQDGPWNAWVCCPRHRQTLADEAGDAISWIYD